jgi:hypothetical protein
MVSYRVSLSHNHGMWLGFLQGLQFDVKIGGKIDRTCSLWRSHALKLIAPSNVELYHAVHPVFSLDYFAALSTWCLIVQLFMETC